MARRRFFLDKLFPKEKPDPTPIHIPGSEAPLTLREEMRRFIRQEISVAAQAQEAGSFEEEDDFDLPDEDSDLVSQYTVLELVPETPEPKDDIEGEPTTEDKAHEQRASDRQSNDTTPPSGKPVVQNSEQPTADPGEAGMYQGTQKAIG